MQPRHLFRTTTHTALVHVGLPTQTQTCLCTVLTCVTSWRSTTFLLRALHTIVCHTILRSRFTRFAFGTPAVLRTVAQRAVRSVARTGSVYTICTRRFTTGYGSPFPACQLRLRLQLPPYHLPLYTQPTYGLQRYSPYLPSSYYLHTVYTGYTFTGSLTFTLLYVYTFVHTVYFTCGCSWYLPDYFTYLLRSLLHRCSFYTFTHHFHLFTGAVADARLHILRSTVLISRIGFYRFTRVVRCLCYAFCEDCTPVRTAPLWFFALLDLFFLHWLRTVYAHTVAFCLILPHLGSDLRLLLPLPTPLRSTACLYLLTRLPTHRLHSSVMLQWTVRLYAWLPVPTPSIGSHVTLPSPATSHGYTHVLHHARTLHSLRTVPTRVQFEPFTHYAHVYATYLVLIYAYAPHFLHTTLVAYRPTGCCRYVGQLLGGHNLGEWLHVTRLPTFFTLVMPPRTTLPRCTTRLLSRSPRLRSFGYTAHVTDAGSHHAEGTIVVQLIGSCPLLPF